MKTRTKFISIILSAIMLISTTPLAMAENTVVIPENTNTVWANDFEFVEKTNGALPSGTTGTAGAKDYSTIDMRVQWADYEIKEDGENQYIYFKPDSTQVSRAGIVGNIFSTGYFKINSGNTVTNGVSTNPAPIDKFKIDKLRLDVSLKLDTYMDAAVCSYYSGKMNDLTSSMYEILSFTSDGKVVLNKTKAGKAEIGTYTPGAWMDIDLYIDYTNHTVKCYINENCQGSTSLDSRYEYFNQIRISANPEKLADDTYNYHGVSVDNIRYSTPYSEDYINRNPYSSDLARRDFEEFKAGDTIASNNSDYYIGSSTNVSAINIVYDTNKKSNVAELVQTAGAGGLFGIPSTNLSQYYSYQKYRKYPDIIKVEFEMKRIGNTAAWASFGANNGGHYTVFYCDLNGNIYFYNDAEEATNYTPVRTSTDKTVTVNSWFKVSLYFNFATGKYQAYLDDSFVAEYTIPKRIKGPDILMVSGHGDCKTYVDNLSISTLPPFESAEIVEYFDLNGTHKLGYVLNNTNTASVMTYQVFCAKFNSSDVLENVTITPASIAAGKMELKAYDKQTASDGGYYKYFVWDGMGTLKPLLSGKVVR